jgi:hypothetical protein
MDTIVEFTKRGIGGVYRWLEESWVAGLGDGDWSVVKVIVSEIAIEEADLTTV